MPSPRVYLEKRYDFLDLPDLVEIQKNSYDYFLKEGLKELFDEFSPVRDFIGRDLELHFFDYYLDEAKFTERDAKARNATYEAPLRVMTRLVNKRTGEMREQEVYLGDIPLMTRNGTFIINGNERAVVSQIIRSSGVLFTSDVVRGRAWYGARIIPDRGAWLEFETAPTGVMSVKIDRKRKVPVTAFLRAFGYGTTEEIRALFVGLESGEHEYIAATLGKDPASTEAEGVKEVYKRIRPGDFATVENARSLVEATFFQFDRYDLSKVGRYKFNQRFHRKYPLTREHRVLKREDVVDVVKEMIRLNITQEMVDDVDHLGNRRIRAVGELVQNRFRIGMTRMERIIRDRMSTLDIHTLTPGQLMNARPVIGAIKEFFMSSQLSQFMDQTNPLAELEHKRRISALGPGGLTRERAGFEVRDVHRTYYGRICPIASPEGPNIGLIGQLATHARVNHYGFIETPFRKVVDGRVTSEIVYLDAFEEEQHTTTPATTPLNDRGAFARPRADVRRRGEPTIGDTNEVEFVDVAPYQIISVSTSLIPFLEHDDGQRTLMASNMQKQAVPYVRPEAPFVGTGLEARAARDSGHALIAVHEGTVTAVDGNQIVIMDARGEAHPYPLQKFLRSNQSTCLNQKPTVTLGQWVSVGDVIADGANIDNGELALGQNLLVAFIPWYGENYEDAILISERVVHEDRFTSIHIEDYSLSVRETKLGPEVVTRDIPNVGDEKLRNLDAEGIIRIGAEVSPGDILVGKITPKGETDLTPEERLLRAIFGEKAKDVRDSSLYLNQGERGKVVDVKIFSREVGDKLPVGVMQQIQVSVATLRKIEVGDKMAGRHGNKGVVSRIVPIEDMPYLANGTPVDIVLNPLGVPSRMNLGQLFETHLGLAAKLLGYTVATTPFVGISEERIQQELLSAGQSPDGKQIIYNGKTGEAFDQPVTVGYKYMMKLNHLVEDKIHQRSIGTYSLVTQQPLGGKAQFGGQRFGEMEVWALEAYGAAYTLQEMLTIKSDDVYGRSKAYEAIIKGEPIKKIHTPESFHVLMRELKGLALDVELLADGKAVELERPHASRY